MGRRTGPVDLLVDARPRRTSSRCTSSSSGRCATRSATGAWRAGARLPSSRALAAELGISRGVVTSAYEQLAAEGYLETAAGRARPRRQGRARPSAETARAVAAAEVRLRLHARACPIWPASPATAGCARCAPPGARASLDAARLRRSAGRARAPRGAGRLPGPRPRRRGRPRAHDRLHRLSPGPVAHVPLAAGQRHRARRAGGTGLARPAADRRGGRTERHAGPGRRRGHRRRRARGAAAPTPSWSPPPTSSRPARC